MKGPSENVGKFPVSVLRSWWGIPIPGETLTIIARKKKKTARTIGGVIATNQVSVEGTSRSEMEARGPYKGSLPMLPLILGVSW